MHAESRGAKRNADKRSGGAGVGHGDGNERKRTDCVSDRHNCKQHERVSFEFKRRIRDSGWDDDNDPGSGR